MLAGQKDEGEEEDHPGNWEVSYRSHNFLWRPESLPAVPLPLSGKAQGE